MASVKPHPSSPAEPYPYERVMAVLGGESGEAAANYQDTLGFMARVACGDYRTSYERVLRTLIPTVRTAELESQPLLVLASRDELQQMERLLVNAHEGELAKDIATANQVFDGQDPVLYATYASGEIMGITDIKIKPARDVKLEVELYRPARLAAYSAKLAMSTRIESFVCDVAAMTDANVQQTLREQL